MPVARATPAIFDRRSVVILNDTTLPTVGGRRRAEAVRGTRRRRARRLRRPLRVAGRRRRADARETRGAGRSDHGPQRDAWTPGSQSRDLRGVQGAAQRRLHIGAHLPLPRASRPTRRAASSRNYDDGAVAAAERRTGAGRVIVWTSTLDDSWTDLAVEARLPPARPPARELPRPVRTDAIVADRRPGRRPRLHGRHHPGRPHRRQPVRPADDPGGQFARPAGVDRAGYL